MDFMSDLSFGLHQLQYEFLFVYFVQRELFVEDDDDEGEQGCDEEPEGEAEGQFEFSHSQTEDVQSESYEEVAYGEHVSQVVFLFVREVCVFLLCEVAYHGVDVVDLEGGAQYEYSEGEVAYEREF